MSHQEAAAEMQVLATAPTGDTGVQHVTTAGPHPGHCPPSRIKLREVLYTFTTLLGLCHCQAVLYCRWRDPCDHTGTFPGCLAHQHGCSQRQARDLRRGHSPLPPVLREMLEEI